MIRVNSIIFNSSVVLKSDRGANCFPFFIVF